MVAQRAGEERTNPCLSSAPPWAAGYWALTATGPGRDHSPFWVTCSTPAAWTVHNSPGGVRKAQHVAVVVSELGGAIHGSFLLHDVEHDDDEDAAAAVVPFEASLTKGEWEVRACFMHRHLCAEG